MHWSGKFLKFALLSTATAVTVPLGDLPEKRDNVAVCSAVLVALKASAFCSSFVPIVDSTSTVSNNGGTQTTIKTVAGSVTCTITVPVGTTTSTSTNFVTVTTLSGTTTVTVSPTSTAPVKRATSSSASSTSSRTTLARSTSAAGSVAVANQRNTATTAVTTVTATQCSIKGLPVQLNIFACDVIKQACLLFVKPKTVKTTITAGSTTTSTFTKAASCTTVTANSQSTVTTGTTSTETVTEPSRTTVTASVTPSTAPFKTCQNALIATDDADNPPLDRFCPSVNGQNCLCSSRDGTRQNGYCTSGTDPNSSCKTDKDCTRVDTPYCVGVFNGSGSLQYQCAATAECVS